MTRPSMYGESKKTIGLSLTDTAKKWLTETFREKYGGTSTSDAIERAARGYRAEQPNKDNDS